MNNPATADWSIHQQIIHTTHIRAVLNMLWELRQAVGVITPNKNPEAELSHKAYNLPKCFSGQTLATSLSSKRSSGHIFFYCHLFKS